MAVDINGVTFIDGVTRLVTQTARLNQMTSWCARSPDSCMKCFTGNSPNVRL